MSRFLIAAIALVVALIGFVVWALARPVIGLWLLLQRRRSSGR